MVEARTIDDLGIGPSTRFAKDQAYLDKTLIKESSFVSHQTQVDVSSPSFSSEFDSLFQISKRYKPWALFWPPQGFNMQKMRLFTHQVVPSLGTEEFQQSLMQKVRDKQETLKQSRKKKKPSGKDKEHAWSDQKEEEEEGRESDQIILFLEYIYELDRMMAAINARRSQYSKG